jgi:hypothetical protein
MKSMPDSRSLSDRPTPTPLNLTADEAQALAMLVDAGVSNALHDDDAAVLERIRIKLRRARSSRAVDEEEASRG